MREHIHGTRASRDDVARNKNMRSQAKDSGQGGGNKTPTPHGSKPTGHMSDVDRHFGRLHRGGAGK